MKAMEKSVMLNRNKVSMLFLMGTRYFMSFLKTIILRYFLYQVHRACAEREILAILDHPFLPTLYASFQVFLFEYNYLISGTQFEVVSYLQVIFCAAVVSSLIPPHCRHLVPYSLVSETYVCVCFEELKLMFAMFFADKNTCLPHN